MAENNTITKQDLREVIIPIIQKLDTLEQNQNTLNRNQSYIKYVVSGIVVALISFVVLIIYLLFSVSNSINTIAETTGANRADIQTLQDQHALKHQ